MSMEKVILLTGEGPRLTKIVEGRQEWRVPVSVPLSVMCDPDYPLDTLSVQTITYRRLFPEQRELFEIAGRHRYLHPVFIDESRYRGLSDLFRDPWLTKYRFQKEMQESR